jgi:hypothetical protein
VTAELVSTLNFSLSWVRMCVRQILDTQWLYRLLGGCANGLHSVSIVDWTPVHAYLFIL